MTVGAIVTIERAILSVLAQAGHTGARAHGTAFVRAIGADVFLPNASYAVPTIASASGLKQADRQLLVKVDVPTATVDGNKNHGMMVTAAGVSVPIQSMMGGGDKNLAPGTLLRWSWPIDGIEASSTVETMSGGLNAPETSLGLVRRIVTFETLGTSEAAAQFFSAGLGSEFPAMVVGWQGSTPWQKSGQGRFVTDHNFRLYVVCSRMDGWGERADEGKEILNDVAEILSDRAEADHEVFASPPLTLGSQGRLALAPTSLVYYQDVMVRYAVKTRELRSFTKLAAVRETLLSDTTAGNPPTKTLVDQSQVIP